jgi:septin family protein
LSDELYDRCRKEGVAAKQKNFKEHLSKLTEKSNAGDELGQEERRIRGRMRTVQEEIDGLENNKNFFANTKNAQSVLAQFDTKIEALKRQIDQMKKEMNLVRTVKPKNDSE